MLRYWFKFVAVLTALCLLPVLLIRAQPYNDHDLRTLLLPLECPMPCFMGIRPGVTTTRDAIAMLQAHEWVETVWLNSDIILEGTFDTNMSGLTELSWTWKHTSPQWINKNIRGWLNFRRGYVNMMAVDTRLRFGDTLLLLGRPDKFAVRIFDNQTERAFRLSAWYLNAGTVISTGGICPMRKYELEIPLVFVSGFQRVEAFDTRRTGC